MPDPINPDDRTEQPVVNDPLVLTPVIGGGPFENDVTKPPTSEEPVDDLEVLVNNPLDPELPVVPDELVPGEPQDHSERSRLGRKVGDLSRDVGTLTTRMSDFMDRYEQQGPPSNKPVETIVEGDDDEIIPMTKAEHRKYLATEFKTFAQQQETTATAYQSSYAAALGRQGLDLPDDEHQAIVEELVSNANINIRRSDDPSQDALINYQLAERNWLRKRGAAPRNPKVHASSNTNLGGEIGGVNPAGPQELPVKLDAFAAEFVKKTGMSVDAVRTALRGPLTPGLGGGRNEQ